MDPAREGLALPKYNGKFLRVRNLEKYQHYKKRSPPWIKLHQSILEDYDFGQLPDAVKWHAVAITLLAARTENHLPADAKWIGARINARTRLDLEGLLSVSFLETCDCERCASNLLASCPQDANSEERHSRGIADNALRRDAASAATNGRIESRQIQAAYEIHCAARVRFFEKINGRPPGTLPDLNAEACKAIRYAIQQHGFAKTWQAGIGVFYSDWHTGRDERTNGKRYLGLPLVWSINRQRNNVEGFAELYDETGGVGEGMAGQIREIMDAHDVA